MTDDATFDRERIIKLQERAHKAHGDDASHRTAWLQYHSALQAAFERGTLVFAPPAIAVNCSQGCWTARNDPSTWFLTQAPPEQRHRGSSRWLLPS